MTKHSRMLLLAPSVCVRFLLENGSAKVRPPQYALPAAFGEKWR